MARRLIVLLSLDSVDHYLTITEAAAHLGITYGSISTYLYTGVLTTFKFKGATLVSRIELDEHRANLYVRRSKRQPMI